MNLAWSRTAPFKGSHLMKQIILIVVATVLTGLFASAQTIASNSAETSTFELTVTVNNTNQLDETAATKLNDYERHPEHWQGDRLVEIARIYMAQKKYPKAAEIYQLVLAKFPNNTNAIRGLGYAHLFTQNYDAAINQFKRGWSLGDELSLLALADTYVAMNHFQDIAPLATDLLKYRKLYSANDEQHELLNALVAYSVNADQPVGTNIFLKALDGVTDSFILERDDTRGMVIFGLEKFGYQDRANQLKDEMDDRMLRAEAAFQTGLAKYNRGDYAGAATDFTKAIGFAPKRGQAYSELAKAQGHLHQYKESITNFTKAIELRQDTWENYSSRGISRQAIGEIIDSFDDFKRSVEVNPQYGDGYVGLAVAQYYALQMQPALVNFRKALELGTTFQDAHAYIWLARSRLGQKSEATQELKTYLKSLPASEKNTWSITILRYLVGELDENAFFKAAKDTAPTSLKAMGQQCQAYYIAGMKHLFDGDKTEAVSLLQKAVDVSVNAPEYYYADLQLKVLRSN